jgi:hypothetical protein
VNSTPGIQGIVGESEMISQNPLANDISARVLRLKGSLWKQVQ